MSVENLNVVDIVSTDRETGEVVLTVSDHLAWDDSIGHQAALQEKLNNYLAFVESGEILDRYPDAKGRLITMKIVLKHQPDEYGEEFLRKAKAVVERAGFGLTWCVFGS